MLIDAIPRLSPAKKNDCHLKSSSMLLCLLCVSSYSGMTTNANTRAPRIKDVCWRSGFDPSIPHLTSYILVLLWGVPWRLFLDSCTSKGNSAVTRHPCLENLANSVYEKKKSANFLETIRTIPRPGERYVVPAILSFVIFLVNFWLVENPWLTGVVIWQHITRIWGVSKQKTTVDGLASTRQNNMT